jgi:hypothetical protein
MKPETLNILNVNEIYTQNLQNNQSSQLNEITPLADDPQPTSADKINLNYT